MLLYSIYDRYRRDNEARFYVAQDLTSTIEAYVLLNDLDQGFTSTQAFVGRLDDLAVLCEEVTVPRTEADDGRLNHWELPARVFIEHEPDLEGECTLPHDLQARAIA